MKDTLQKIFSSLFGAALIAFLLLATCMVLLQIIGALTAQGGLVSGAHDALLHPSIVMGICAGIFGFISYYTVADNATGEG